MLFKRRPKNFSPKFEVVSCFCEYDSQILLLLRQDYKPQGNKWGVPAGKKDPEDRDISEAILRELREETELNLKKKDVSYFKKVYVKYPDLNFVYHIFHSILKDRPEVKIREVEHKGYKWIKPQEALKLDLIEDLDNCIKLFYSISS